VIDIVLKKNMLRDGCNPFKQIIVMVVSEHKRISTSEVIEKIIRDYRLCADNDNSRRYLRELVKWLRIQGYLNLVEGVLERGARKLPLGDMRIPIEYGYNPIMKAMFDFIERKDVARKREIELYMISRLQWIEDDPVTGKTANETFEVYLQHLLDEGVIKEVNPNEYMVAKPIEPYQ